MEEQILTTALAPGDDCLSSEQLGRYADGALDAGERDAAERHLRGCLTCQAELALLRTMTASSVREDEADLVRDGVARLERRAAEIFRSGPAQPARQPGARRAGSFPLAAVAALLLVGIAAGSFYFLRTRAPDLPGSLATGGEITRSPAIVARQPIGNQSEAPQRAEWVAVDRAARYRVRLLEVDRTEVWSALTTAPAMDLPADVRAAFAPGKTVLWDVTAYDAAGTAIAESGLLSFRVAPR